MKSFLEQFLEYFPRSVRFTPEQNRQLTNLKAFSDRKPIEQINALALDFNLKVSYNPDGSLTISE